MSSAVNFPARTFGPLTCTILDNPRDRPLIFARRAKIPAARKVDWVVESRFREDEAATERLEHVLPWPCRGGIANCKHSAG